MGLGIRVFVLVHLLFGVSAFADETKEQRYVFPTFIQRALDFYKPENNAFIAHQMYLVKDYWGSTDDNGVVRNTINKTIKDFDNLPGFLKRPLGAGIDKLLLRGAEGVHDAEAKGKMEKWVEESSFGPTYMKFHARAVEFLKVFTLIDTPAYTERAQKIINQLTPCTEDRYLWGHYNIYIVDVSMDQGFSTGGGSIYLTRGIMDALNDDELAGVLAHEMAHSEQGHAFHNLFTLIGSSVGHFGLQLAEITKLVEVGNGQTSEFEVTLFDHVAQTVGKMAPFQEKEADKRAKEIVAACSHYDPKGLEKAVAKLIARSNVLDTGSARQYPNAFERAGMKMGESIATFDANALEPYILGAEQDGLPIQFLRTAVRAIGKVNIQNNEKLEAVYSLTGLGSRKGDFVVGSRYYNPKTNSLRPWSSLAFDQKGLIYHEMFHAYLHYLKLDNDLSYRKMRDIAQERFTDYLPGQRYEVYEELLAAYIETIISKYGQRITKNRVLAEDKRARLQGTPMAERIVTLYNMTTGDVYETYAGAMVATYRLQPEDPAFLNSLIFENKISGDFNTDFGNIFGVTSKPNP